MIDELEQYLKRTAAELAAAQRTITRIRALHYETTDCHTDSPNGCDECRHALNYCDACGYEWPCPTIRALDGSDGCTGRLHHNHTTRGIKQRGECPACDGYHAQREQR